MNQFKINILLNNVIQRVSTSLRMSREIPHSQLSYLKVTDQVENDALWQIIHMFSVKTMEHFTICH